MELTKVRRRESKDEVWIDNGENYKLKMNYRRDNNMMIIDGWDKTWDECNQVQNSSLECFQIYMKKCVTEYSSDLIYYM